MNTYECGSWGRVVEPFADLAQTRLLEDPAFVNYLKYLEYWRQPQYAKFIMYVEFIELQWACTKHWSLDRIWPYWRSRGYASVYLFPKRYWYHDLWVHWTTYWLTKVASVLVRWVFCLFHVTSRRFHDQDDVYTFRSGQLAEDGIVHK